MVVVPGGGLARDVRRDEWIATIGRDDELEPQGNWWSVPELEGGGIRLRAFQPTDAPRITEACNDERTQYWLAGLPSPYQLSDAEGFMRSRQDTLASGEGVPWAIADAASDQLLGCVSVFDLNNRIDKTMGEIGYWLHPDARGRKVMSTAVGLVIEHAFRPIADGGLGRRRLVLFAAEGNTASAHVAEVNGFTAVSTERRASPRRDGEFLNLLGFDLLATDSPPVTDRRHLTGACRPKPVRTPGRVRGLRPGCLRGGNGDRPETTEYGQLVTDDTSSPRRAAF